MPLRALVVDFNSFFASVEQQERPELRGRPVAVLPVMAETTGCIAVSIEAKQRGLKRNLRVAEARAVVPDLVFVESRPETYIAYHQRLVRAIESCLHIDHIGSIDEVTCGLTGRFAQRAEAVAAAQRIKAAVRRDVGEFLRCSIGVAPNWLLAKVASDLEKPDGLVVLEEADLTSRLAALEPGDVAGIGPGIQQRLRDRGITTMSDLLSRPMHEWRSLWGSVRGEQMWRLLRGEDIPFFEQQADQTIGHGHVLPPDLRTEKAAFAVLHRLLQKAAMRLRDSGLYAGVLQAQVSFANEQRWSDELQFNETQDTLRLTHALNQLWQRRPRSLRGAEPRKVAVRLGRLLRSEAHTPDLFAADEERTHGRLLSAVDQLNKTFGKNSVVFGGALGATGYAPMRIAFTRIPKPELEEIDRARGRRLRPPPAAPATPLEDDST